MPNPYGPDWRPSWLPACDCYARYLAPAVQFALRYGAHAVDCPVWRESRDPVDAAEDREFRAAGQFPRVVAQELAVIPAVRSVAVAVELLDAPVCRYCAGGIFGRDCTACNNGGLLDADGSYRAGWADAVRMGE